MECDSSHLILSTRTISNWTSFAQWHTYLFIGLNYLSATDASIKWSLNRQSYRCQWQTVVFLPGSIMNAINNKNNTNFQRKCVGWFKLNVCHFARVLKYMALSLKRPHQLCSIPNKQWQRLYRIDDLHTDQQLFFDISKVQMCHCWGY